MPNLAKDMGTQTTISYESSETDSDDEAAPFVEDSTNPATPKISMTLELLQPLEERKKAFLNPEQAPPGPFSSSPIKQSWKSMPSLNKTPPPLPLVGACYPNRPEDIDQLPIKDIKQLFEQKSQFLTAMDQQLSSADTRKRSSSTSSVSSLSSATNPSVILDDPNATPNAGKCSKNSQVIYRWDDESNGEIYTDRPDLVKVDQVSSDQESSLGLYVVENGKEYPLIPLRQRKSLFETVQTQQVLSYKVTPLINNHEKKTAASTVVAEIPAINLLREPPVKSSTVPYIQEEQEILQKIDLVSKIKPKFGSK